MINKKVAIIHASHDGIVTHHCGVGTIVHEHLIALDWICSRVDGIDLKVYVATPKFKNVSSFNKAFSQFSHRLCSHTLGKFLNCGSKLQVRWPTPNLWQGCSADLTQAVFDISRDCDILIVFCHDGSFSYAAIADYPENVYVYWIPHSTSLTNKYDSPDKIMFKIENDVINGIMNSNAKILCISEFMKKHLEVEYKANTESLIVFENSYAYMRFSENFSDSIPTNIILSGRCAPYKKILEAVIAFKNLSSKKSKETNNLKLILNTIRDVSHPKYYNEVMKIAHKQDNIFINDKFSSYYPTKVYSQCHCAISLSTSISEPFGLAPLEARVFGHGVGPIILVPNRGGLSGQVSNMFDGLVYNADKAPEQLTDKLIEINRLPLTERKRIARNGRLRVLENNWLLPKLNKFFKNNGIHLGLDKEIQVERIRYLTKIGETTYGKLKIT